MLMNFYTLPQLTDLALGEPEVGSVNFNILRTILKTIIKELNLELIRPWCNIEDETALQNAILNEKKLVDIKVKASDKIPETEEYEESAKESDHASVSESDHATASESDHAAASESDKESDIPAPFSYETEFESALDDKNLKDSADIQKDDSPTLKPSKEITEINVIRKQTNNTEEKLNKVLALMNTILKKQEQTTCKTNNHEEKLQWSLSKLNKLTNEIKELKQLIPSRQEIEQMVRLAQEMQVETDEAIVKEILDVADTDDSIKRRKTVETDAITDDIPQLALDILSEIQKEAKDNEVKNTQEGENKEEIEGENKEGIEEENKEGIEGESKEENKKEVEEENKGESKEVIEGESKEENKGVDIESKGKNTEEAEGESKGGNIEVEERSKGEIQKERNRTNEKAQILKSLVDRLMERMDIMQEQLENIEEKKAEKDELKLKVDKDYFKMTVAESGKTIKGLSKNVEEKADKDELDLKVDKDSFNETISDLKSSLNSLSGKAEEKVNRKELEQKVDINLFSTTVTEVEETITNLTEKLQEQKADRDELEFKVDKEYFNATVLELGESIRIVEKKMHEKAEKKELEFKVDLDYFGMAISELAEAISDVTRKLQETEKLTGVNEEFYQVLDERLKITDFQAQQTPLLKRVRSLMIGFKRLKSFIIGTTFPEASAVTKCLSCGRVAELAERKHITSMKRSQSNNNKHGEIPPMRGQQIPLSKNNSLLCNKCRDDPTDAPLHKAEKPPAGFEEIERAISLTSELGISNGAINKEETYKQKYQLGKITKMQDQSPAANTENITTDPIQNSKNDENTIDENDHEELLDENPLKNDEQDKDIDNINFRMDIANTLDKKLPREELKYKNAPVKQDDISYVADKLKSPESQE